MKTCPKKYVIGKQINFCPNCNWFEVQEGRDDYSIKKCPKCKTHAWEMYEYHYYKNNKLFAKEAGLSDNDESHIKGESLKELKKIFEKGMYLIKYKRKKRIP